MSRRALAKEVLSSTGVYAIAVIASKMASFLLLPLYTSYLSPADYGVLELLEMTSFILSSLLGMRLGDALFFFYSRAASEEERHQTVCTVFAGAVLFGAVGAALSAAGAAAVSRVVFGSPAYASYFYFVSISFFFSMPLEIGFAYMRVVNSPASYVTASLLRLGLAIVVNVILLAGLGLRVGGILWSSATVAGFMAFYMAVFTLTRLRVRHSFRPHLLGAFMRFSAPLAITSLSMFSMNYADRFFLRHYVTLADLGVYSLAYKIGMLMMYIPMPFEVYWGAQKYQLIKRADGEQIFARICTYLTLVMTFSAVLLTVFAKPVVRLMASPEFAAAALYVPWIAAAYLARVVGSNVRHVFFLEGKTVSDATITWTSAVVCLAGYAALVPRFRIWGAIASTGIAFVTMMILSFLQAQKVRRIPYEYGRLGRIAAAAAVTAILTPLLPDPLWAQLAGGAALAALFPTVLLATGFLMPDEKDALGVLLRHSRTALAWRTGR